MKSRLVTTTVRCFLSAVLCLTLILGVTVREARAFPDYISGIGYEYYEVEPGEIFSLLGTNFDTLTPVAEGITENFNISLRQQDDFFAFRFKAHIEIVTGGNYTFYTKSDDGSLLYIGETLVVNNDGYHGVFEKSGAINLSAGYHPITVMFFEGGGGQMLEVSYEGPGISKQLIPDDVLANGIITYTPNAGFYGTDSFTYKVTDGRVDSNFTTVSITVNRVITPPEIMLEELRDYVDTTGLPEATKNSLNSSLEVAISALEDSNPKNDLVAANVLKAFINKVEAQRGKKISEGFADELITKAQEIAAALE